MEQFESKQFARVTVSDLDGVILDTFLVCLTTQNMSDMSMAQFDRQALAQFKTTDIEHIGPRGIDSLVTGRIGDAVVAAGAEDQRS